MKLSQTPPVQWAYRWFSRLAFGINIHKVSKNHTRMTVPAKNQAMVDNLIKSTEAAAWRKGIETHVEHRGDLTVINAGGNIVEIKVVK